MHRVNPSRCSLVAFLVCLAPACVSSGPPTTSADWRSLVVGSGDDEDLGALRFLPDACDGIDRVPEFATLDESSVVRFLRVQRLDVQVQRQQVEGNDRELNFVFVRAPDATTSVALRVAVLHSADDAGRALHEGILSRGSGAWGIRRANVAVLGPSESLGEALAFVVATKLSCWGTFTVAGTDDAFVVPGGYAEP